MKKAVTGKEARAANKLFVLDTNTLMDSAKTLFILEEHDVCVPEPVIEELDEHKKGVEEINRNSRQAGRDFDALQYEAIKAGISLDSGIPLSITGKKEARGKAFIGRCGIDPPEVFRVRNNDNLIIERALYHKEHDRQYADVVLLSNDANVRIKARSVGLAAESVRGDVEVADEDVIPNNIHTPKDSFWSEQKKVECKQKNGLTYYTIFGRSFSRWKVSDFALLPPQGEGGGPVLMQVTCKKSDMVVLRVIEPGKTGSVWGIHPRNDRQHIAAQLLLCEDLPFVSLIGVAGTGKTLLTLACGLEQALEKKRFDEIIMTRALVPIDREIGFLPGTEEEKMNPWMGALEDNLDVLNKNDAESGDWGRAATRDLIRSRIKVKSLNFMRGRTFMNKLLIIDEAQNLSQKQAKTIISRAGEGSKVVFLGNVAQIDSPYLSEHNCGLVQTIHRFRDGGFIGSGYVMLQRGERSLLADAANMYL